MKKDLMIAHTGARLLGGLKIFGRLLALVVALLSVSRPCAASVQVLINRIDRIRDSFSYRL